MDASAERPASRSYYVLHSLAHTGQADFKFEDLIEDLPARAARENFGKSALAEGPDRH